MKIRRSRCAVGALAAAAAAAPGLAQTSIDLEPAKDNTLYNDATGALSNGAGTRLFAGVAGLNAEAFRRGLLAFDVAGAIPAGSVISSATLTMTVVQAADNAAVDFTLHRVEQDWGEAGSIASAGQGGGGQALDGDATWLHTFSSGSFWASPGGDFDPVADASTAVGGQGEYTWSGSGLTSAVQDWLDNPGTNFGWLLRTVEDSGTNARAFASREFGSAAFRPNLAITYVPGPGVLAIGLLSAPFSTRRRRR